MMIRKFCIGKDREISFPIALISDHNVPDKGIVPYGNAELLACLKTLVLALVGGYAHAMAGGVPCLIKWLTDRLP